MESEIFNSDSALASAEYTPTLIHFKILDSDSCKLQSELPKFFAVSKRPYLVFASKRLKNCMNLLITAINVSCFSDHKGLKWP